MLLLIYSGQLGNIFYTASLVVAIHLSTKCMLQCSYIKYKSMITGECTDSLDKTKPEE